ncbi:MAG: ATP phosphoribosyltransferase regulatory subunit [Okeania sp. SIO2H7]|nr:ATP phosphoribosyltransferase regulatory subunit [Okeania sp. SIO2H7]
MRSTKVERVPGVNDLLPDAYQTNQQIENTLAKSFQSFGYRPIAIPILEHTELYLRKSGEDIVTRLYDFTYRNRRLCLRPEFTASVVRAYLDNFQNLSLPLRLYYSGPAFRYERPQKEKYRQFTQMGVELLGAAGAIADAEIISTASTGLNSLGLTDYKVVIGNIGVLNQFLDNLQIENRLRSLLLSMMETLRKEGKEAVEKRLKRVYSSLRTYNFYEEETEVDPTTNTLTEILHGMQEADGREAILHLLKNMNIGLDGNRDPEEIVDRLLAKIKRRDQTPLVGQALDFMKELGQLQGEPLAVVKEAEKLLSVYQIDASPLQQLHQIIDTLEFYGLDRSKISFDLGVSRGLQYYTGTIFEIYHGPAGAEKQICGGGRYDDLILTLGGKQQTPATGFSYSMERLQQALEIEGKLPRSSRFVDALVMPVSSEDNGYAIAIAQKLRKSGLRVEFDVTGKGVSTNLESATKLDIPFAIIIGADERKADKVVLKNLASEEQKTLSIEEAIEQLKIKN